MLELELDHDPRTGRRAAVEAALREAIRSGRLRSGDVLPSTRSLAADLGLARGTIVDAYSQLAGEGWVTSRPGAATTVSATIERGDGVGPRRPANDRPATRPPAIAQPDVIGLSPGLADLGAFPRTQWTAAVRKVMQTAPDRVLGHVDPQGRLELRSALAGMLARARGVVADPERIVIVNGFTQGLALLSSVLRREGTPALAMEDPNLPQHRDVVTAAGLRVERVQVDEHGAKIEQLRDLTSTVFVTTPSHQHPLGMSLHPDRRASLLEWAIGCDGVVVEDDYDGEFRYDRQPLAALQARAPEHVIYAGTAGKALAVGLRLGWFVVPPGWVDRMVVAKRTADAGTAVIDQLALAEIIANGVYERHVRKMRISYRQRRDQLVAVLAERAPDVRVEGLAAGLHAVIRLPVGGPTEAEVVEAARAARLEVAALGPFWHRPGNHPPAVLVSYAAPPAHAFTATIERFADVLADATRSQRPSRR